MKLVQYQPQLNREIQPFVVEGIHYTAKFFFPFQPDQRLKWKKKTIEFCDLVGVFLYVFSYIFNGKYIFGFFHTFLVVKRFC